MALGDATTTSFVLVLGILALCPVVEAEHGGITDYLTYIVIAVVGVFIGIPVLVVAYQIYNMIPPKETIYYDDHCCCWSQLNKDDGPKQFNSIEFVRVLLMTCAMAPCIMQSANTIMSPSLQQGVSENGRANI